jgi:two-component system sensor histidine kinase/response regulator
MIDSMGATIYNLLMIEDNPGDAKLIRHFLGEPAHNTRFVLHTANRLAAGLDFIANHPVDVVLLDLHLPDSMGIETVERLLRAAPKLPVVVLTSIDDDDLGMQAVSQGAQDFLLKGQVDSPLLLRALRYAIERKFAEEEIRHHAQQLEERNQELDAFSYIVAHDLKGPLSLVTGYTDLLLSENEQAIPSEQLAWLEVIKDQSLRMQNIISSLLLLSQLRDADDIIEIVSMQPIIQSSLNYLDRWLTERGVRVEVGDTLPPVLGHAPWLEAVLTNLLSNAIKYIGHDNTDPRIYIRGYQQGQVVRYEIEDNGIGIDRKHRDRLFEMFTRVHPEEASGFGLGLSIVKRIIVKLNGYVNVESEPGVGSTFWFILPGPNNCQSQRRIHEQEYETLSS